MTCFYCGAQMHFLCGDCKCCDGSVVMTDELQPLEEILPTRRGAKPKDGESMKDVLSTGRKRAAKKYGHLVGGTCEWAWSKSCGGGIRPIIGCAGRISTNIHHGPDKSTINNERDNISIICPFCHNLWHARNDPSYSDDRLEAGRPWLPSGVLIHSLSEKELCDPIEVMDQEFDLDRPKVDSESLKSAMAAWKKLQE